MADFRTDDFYLVDITTDTKKVHFNVASTSTDRQISFDDADGTVALTNSNSGEQVFSVSNQIFQDVSLEFRTAGSPVGGVQWTNTSTAKSIVLTVPNPSAASTGVTLPDITGTLMSLAGTQVITGWKKFDVDTATTGLYFLYGTDASSLPPLSVYQTTGPYQYDIGFPSALSGNATFTLPLAGGVATTNAGTQTLTNKRITQRVVTMTDATSFTPTGDTADMNTQANTQATGTLTANAPSGTPTNGQRLLIRIKSTNVQTFAWNAIYRGGTTVALPTVTSGGSKTDYFEFRYESTGAKWDIQRVNLGY